MAGPDLLLAQVPLELIALIDRQRLQLGVVVHDVRRQEDQQVDLVAAVVVRLEQVAEHRDVADVRQLSLRRYGVVRDQAADHDRVARPSDDRRRSRAHGRRRAGDVRVDEWVRDDG